MLLSAAASTDDHRDPKMLTVFYTCILFLYTQLIP